MTGKSKLYIIWVIFIVSILLMVLFLVYPLFKDIQNSAAKILAQRSQIVAMTTEDEKLALFKENYQAYQPNLEKIDTLFVDAKDPLNFITFLENTATVSKVGIQVTLLPSKDQKIDTWPALAFTVSARGDFSNTMAFIKKLETGPYVIKIQHILIKKGDVIDTKQKALPIDVDAQVILQVVAK